MNSSSINSRFIRYPNNKSTPCHEAKVLAFDSVPQKTHQHKKTRLQHELEHKINHALSMCNHDKIERNDKDCTVMWDEIEELSSTLNNLNNERR